VSKKVFHTGIVFFFLIAVCANSITNNIEIEKEKDKLEELINKAVVIENKTPYKAIEIYHEALTIAANEGSSLDIGFIHKKIGLIYYAQKDFNKASKHFRECISVDSLSQNSADSYLNLSLLYRKQKRQDSLLFSLNKSLQIYNSLEPSDQKYKAYLKAGILYKNAGLYNDAMRYLLLAHEGFTKNINDTKRAVVSNTIGSIQRILGNHGIAKEYYFEGLALRHSAKDSIGISNSCNSIANLFYEQSQFDSAVIYYKKAIASHSLLRKEKEKGRMTSNLAMAFYKKGDKKRAFQTYREALTIKRSEQDTLALTTTYNELAIISIENKNYSLAKKYLDSKFGRWLSED